MISIVLFIYSYMVSYLTISLSFSIFLKWYHGNLCMLVVIIKPMMQSFVITLISDREVEDIFA